MIGKCIFLLLIFIFIGTCVIVGISFDHKITEHANSHDSISYNNSYEDINIKLDSDLLIKLIFISMALVIGLMMLGTELYYNGR